MRAGAWYRRRGDAPATAIDWYSEAIEPWRAGVINRWSRFRRTAAAPRQLDAIFAQATGANSGDAPASVVAEYVSAMQALGLPVRDSLRVSAFAVPALDMSGTATDLSRWSADPAIRFRDQFTPLSPLAPPYPRSSVRADSVYAPPRPEALRSAVLDEAARAMLAATTSDDLVRGRGDGIRTRARPSPGSLPATGSGDGRTGCGTDSRRFGKNVPVARGRPGGGFTVGTGIRACVSSGDRPAEGDVPRRARYDRKRRTARRRGRDDRISGWDTVGRIDLGKRSHRYGGATRRAYRRDGRTAAAVCDCGDVGFSRRRRAVIRSDRARVSHGRAYGRRGMRSYAFWLTGFEPTPRTSARYARSTRASSGKTPPPRRRSPRRRGEAEARSPSPEL